MPNQNSETQTRHLNSGEKGNTGLTLFRFWNGGSKNLVANVCSFMQFEDFKNLQLTCKHAYEKVRLLKRKFTIDDKTKNMFIYYRYKRKQSHIDSIYACSLSEKYQRPVDHWHSHDIDIENDFYEPKSGDIEYAFKKVNDISIKKHGKKFLRLFEEIK